MSRLLLTTALVCIAGPAAADPVSSVTTALIGLGVSKTAAAALAAGIVRVGGYLAVSVLTKAVTNRSGSSGFGVSESYTFGEAVPQSFILGTYATSGHRIADMSHGVNGDTRYFTRVLSFGNIPMTSLEYLIVDGVRHDMSGAVDPDYGATSELEDYTDYFWVKAHDGRQTAADPGLLSRYGSYPERPWTDQMIGRGLPYGIFTFLWRNKPQIWTQVPRIKAIWRGAPLYDPRKDSTVGGTGDQRFGDAGTYEFTANVAVMIYNLYRGIYAHIPGIGSFRYFGGQASFEALPLSNWIAAMNICDEQITTADGVTKARFTAGIEVKPGTPDRRGHTPFDIVDELLKACGGKVAEVGGHFFIQIGGIGLPVRFITDETVIRSQPRDADPFLPHEALFNAVHATYPSPDELWETREAPGRYDPVAEAEDGERLIADYPLPAAPDGEQVQRVADFVLKDFRRMVRHNITLPPDALSLNPLEAISWTSAQYGYTDEVFEIGRMTTSPRALLPTLSIRAANPIDANWTPDRELPTVSPSTAPAAVAPLPVPGADVEAGYYVDGDGVQRGVFVAGVFAADIPDATGVIGYLRLASDQSHVATRGPVDPGQGRVEFSEVVGSTAYQVQLELVTGKVTTPSMWMDITTPPFQLGAADIDVDTILADVEAGVAAAQEAASEAQQNAADLFAGAQSQIDGIVEELNFDPVQIDHDRQIDAAFAMLADLYAAYSTLGSQIADAGIYTDPVTGQVNIEGVAAAGNQIAAILVSVDAVNATLTQTVTYAEMSEAITAAQLDPSQLIVVDDLWFSINQLGTVVDGITGELTTFATQIEVDGQDVRLLTAEQNISLLQGEIATTVQQTEFDDLGERVTGVETVLSVFDGASYEILLYDYAATATSVSDLANLTLEQLLQEYEDRETAVTEQALIREEYAAFVIEGREAVASVRTELGASISNAVALFRDENTVRVTEIEALGQSLTAFDLRLSDAESGLGGVVLLASELSGSVSQIEDGLALEGAAIDQIALDLSDLADDVAGVQVVNVAQAGAISGIQATLTQQGDTISALVVAEEALDIRLGSVETDLDATVGTLNQTLALAEANETATLLQATQIASLSAALNGKADVSALTALGVEIDQQGDQITALAAQQSGLQVQVDAGAFSRRFDFSGQTLDGLILEGTGASVGYGTTTDTSPMDKDHLTVTFGSDNFARLRYNVQLPAMRGKTMECQVRLAPSSGLQTAVLEVLQYVSSENLTYARVLSSATLVVPDVHFTDAAQILRVSIPDDEKLSYAIRLRIAGAAGQSCKVTDLVFRDGSVEQSLAVIQAVQTVQGTNLTALADDLTVVDASLGSLSATVTTQGTALATLEGEQQSIATQLTAVEATADGAAAAVTQQATAIADLEGNQAAALVFAATAGGAVSSLELVAADNPGGPVQSTIRFTSDLSIFDSEALQSSNFIAGVQGWRITKPGDAELNSVIDRSSIKEDLRTVEWQEIGAGPYQASTSQVTVLTLNIGAVPKGSIYQRGLVFQARQGSSAIGLVTVKLQSRNKQLGSGTFTAWRDLDTFEIGASSQAWEVFADTGSLAGFYDEYEYRVVYETLGAGTANVLREVYLTVINRKL